MTRRINYRAIYGRYRRILSFPDLVLLAVAKHRIKSLPWTTRIIFWIRRRLF